MASINHGMRGTVPSVQRSTAGRPDSSPLRKWEVGILFLGILLLIGGMCVFPTGASFNPGKPYQYLLSAGLYLPVLVIGIVGKGRWWSTLRMPLMPWILAFMVWGAISTLWSDAPRTTDVLLRNLSVLLFLFAWIHGVGEDASRKRWLMIAGAGMIGLATLAAMVGFAIQPPADGRLVGTGGMRNANLAAAAIGAAFLWLLPLRFDRPLWLVLKWMLLATLGGGLLLTFTRSAWLALGVGVVILSIAERGRRSATYAIPGIALGAAIYMIHGASMFQRGWSMRPEILAEAWELFLQSPGLGAGLGSPLILEVNGTGFVHSHNLFVQVALEMGLPGFILWTGIWLAAGYRAWRWRKHAAGSAALSLWAFATVLVQFDLPHLLHSPRPVWLVVWFPLAMIVCLMGRRSHEASP